MKLGLSEKIQKITGVSGDSMNIGEYGESKLRREAEIRSMLESYKVKGHRYTVDGLRQEIGEQMKEIVAAWKADDVVFNQRINAIVEEAESVLLKEINISMQKKRPADYETKISVAMLFVKDLLKDSLSAEDLDDELSFALKDFMDDIDTMERFKRMIERRYPGFINASGECVFPKTFRESNNPIVKTLMEMKSASETVFLGARDYGNEVIRIQGISFSIPMDTYSMMADQATVENCAVILDALADKIDSEGQSETSGSGQKIDDPSIKNE